ncbi:MAG: DUF169 domain-containing protein [Candidatus Hadarchaeaceae archaeon]
MSMSPVAIRISDKVEEIPGAKRPSSSISYAEALRRAATFGDSFLLLKEDINRTEDEINLGFSEPVYVDIQPRVKPAKTRSVYIAPLEKFVGRADVILVISNPVKMMKLVQIFHRLTGEMFTSSMKASGGVCSGEATAIPLVDKRANLTLLCSGDRIFGGFREDELMMGLPAELFFKVVDLLKEPKLTEALCGCLMSDIPDNLKEGLLKLGFEKATDHFFGKIGDKSIRLYIDKDESGAFSRLAVHAPLKLTSRENSEQAAALANKLLAGEGFAKARENWLDLVVLANFKEGLDKIALDEKRLAKELTSRVAYLSNIIKILKKDVGT